MDIMFFQLILKVSQQLCYNHLLLHTLCVFTMPYILPALQLSGNYNSNEPSINENNFPPGKPPPKINPYQQLFRSKPSTNNNVELFIKSIEKELFNPNNFKKTRNNLNKEEKLALKEMKSWNDKVIRVQDKGSRFVVLDTNSYIEKVEHQISREVPLTNLMLIQVLNLKKK